MNFQNLTKIDKHYVSPIDKFLINVKEKYPKSTSQEREYKKHERIAELMKNPNAGEKDQLWEKF